MKRLPSLLIIAIIAATVFYGCNEKKPEKYGVYIKTAKNTIEILNTKSKMEGAANIDAELAKEYCSIVSAYKNGKAIDSVAEIDYKKAMQWVSMFQPKGKGTKANTEVKKAMVRAYDVEVPIKQFITDNVVNITVRDPQSQNIKIWYDNLKGDSGLVEVTDFKILNKDIEWAIYKPVRNLQEGIYFLACTSQKPETWDQNINIFAFVLGSPQKIKTLLSPL